MWKISAPFPLSPYLISRQTFPTLWSQIFESDFEQIWISILRASQKHNVFKAGLLNFCVVGKSSEYNPVESRLLDNNWTSWQSVIGKPATHSRLNLKNLSTFPRVWVLNRNCNRRLKLRAIPTSVVGWDLMPTPASFLIGWHFLHSYLSLAADNYMFKSP